MKVGIDLVEIERIKKLLQKHPAAKRRLFTEEEISYCERQADPYPSYAARFAAKEAVFKALGEFIGWRNVCVRRDSGKPALFVKGKKARAELSLSHTKGLAVAIVVFLE